MAATIVNTVIEALNTAGIEAQTAYPGSAMQKLTSPRVAVNLEKMEYTARKATVLVTVMVPSSMGGTACEDTALQVGTVLEKLGGVCVQEGCAFHNYADAYYVRVLGTFTGGAVMEEWAVTSTFKVLLNQTEIPNAVGFRADVAVDEVTGTPLSTAVWTFRLEEEYGRGETPPVPPADIFSVTVYRTSGMELFSDCSWTAIQMEDTATGLRMVRTGVATSRSFMLIV